METQIHMDKSGRVVIPKEMRDGLGFTPETPLLIEETPQGLLLKASDGGRMVEKDGIWVYRPHSAESYDPVEILRKVREER